ncbi:hypothetical protein B0T16DRAFT_395143 [Cercophora newfieldiana]|uniref:Uncharacterized protein n=1 Tax=Cercophora newfieldiana TaxID=92897 RepID=A0AA39XUM2_9PEZI|nr:hypothetical protein B0T16DRAFT_395143 [Cercophora newfieldiana]
MKHSNHDIGDKSRTPKALEGELPDPPMGNKPVNQNIWLEMREEFSPFVRQMVKESRASKAQAVRELEASRAVRAHIRRTLEEKQAQSLRTLHEAQIRQIRAVMEANDQEFENLDFGTNFSCEAHRKKLEWLVTTAHLFGRQIPALGARFKAAREALKADHEKELRAFERQSDMGMEAVVARHRSQAQALSARWTEEFRSVEALVRGMRKIRAGEARYKDELPVENGKPSHFDHHKCNRYLLASKYFGRQHKKKVNNIKR